MPAEEETRGAVTDGSRVRTGPRHAVFRKPLLARLQMPAGKAMALAAVPTAVLMGMGVAPALARADDKATTTRSLTLDEYQTCVEVLEKAEDADEAAEEDGVEEDGVEEDGAGEDGAGEGGTEEDGAGQDAEVSAPPSPSVPPSAPASGGGDVEQGPAEGGDPSPDSGSDDESGSEPAPAPSTGAPAGSSQGTDRSLLPGLPGVGDVLEGIGDALGDVLTPGGSGSTSPAPAPSTTPSAPAGEDGAEPDPGPEEDTGATDDPAGPPEEPAGDATGPAAGPTRDATEPAGEPSGGATASAGSSPSPSPSPSESAAMDPDDCPVATDAEGGLEQDLPALPDDPWYLDASSLLLKGADYQGVVQVRTASGSVKEVLKYVISDGTDIGDLHQTVKDTRTGTTHHVQAGAGTTSTIRDGDTVMYTESISGNLLGLVPVEFSPENPPPLNIPLIYFTDVRVVQAGQFGGTLHIPGLHQYMTD